ncbi:hypothetical protein ACOMHN_018357 [Nucella lapillus]
MNERRSGRARKQVDYGKLPLDDKLYECDLQAALEKSLEASQRDDDNEISEPVNSHAILHSTPMVDSDLPLIKTEESQSIMPSAIPQGVAADDKIEFLGSVSCGDSPSPPAKRRAAASSRKKASAVYDDDESTDDEDFSGEESESDSDFNDADSDFDDGKVKGKFKKQVKGKAAPKQSKATAAPEKKSRSATKCSSKAPSTGGRTTPTAPKPEVSTVQSKAPSSGKGVTDRGGTSSAPVKSSASVSSRLPAAPHKAPAWTPPGRSDSSNSRGSNSLKSPSSGLRLGLSRHARTKPLHPSLKVS